MALLSLVRTFIEGVSRISLLLQHAEYHCDHNFGSLCPVEVTFYAHRELEPLRCDLSCKVVLVIKSVTHVSELVTWLVKSPY